MLNTSRIEQEVFKAYIPERELICEIIKLAVADSLEQSSAYGSGVTKELAQNRARKWLETSPTYEFYCDLVDIDRQAMLDRLCLRW